MDAVQGTLLGSQSDRLDLTETLASGTRLDGARVTFTTTAAPTPRLQPRVHGPASYRLKESTFRKIDTLDVGSAPPETPPTTSPTWAPSGTVPTCAAAFPRTGRPNSSSTWSLTKTPGIPFSIR